MEEWSFKTVLPVYRLIENGKKTYDTRAPDLSNTKKRLSELKIGDKALIVPVDDDFQSLDLPTLEYKVSDVQYFKPRDNEEWQSVIRRMFNSIELNEVFPGYSLEEALDMYREWSVTSRIRDYGIVAIELGG